MFLKFSIAVILFVGVAQAGYIKLKSCGKLSDSLEFRKHS